MNLFRKFLLFIFSLFLMAAAAAFLIYLSIAFTLSQENYFKDKIGQDYYTKAAAKMMSGFESVGLASGVPADVFKGTVTAGDMKSQTELILHHSFSYINGTSKTLNTDLKTTELESKLRNKLNAYVEANHITPDRSNIDGINQIIRDCSAIYKSNMTPIPYYDSILKTIRSVSKLFYKFLFILFPASVILILLIYITGSRKYGTVYLLYSFISAGLLTAILSGLVLIFKYPYRINIDDESVRFVLGNVLSGFFVFMTAAGVILSAVSAAVYVFFSKRRNF